MIFNTSVLAFERPVVFHAPAMLHVCSYHSFFTTSYAIHEAAEYKSSDINVLIDDNFKW